MDRIIRLSFGVLFFLLTACATENSIRHTGAGYDLYSPSQTPAATKNLLNYFDELCAQAGIATISIDRLGNKTRACPSGLRSDQYTKLLQAGLNDIDLRCDRYLGWIDRKRIEALTYRRGAGALEAFLGSALTIDNRGPRAFAGLLAVFTLGRDLYDASNTSLLAALESSTIKTIVYKRQRAFRNAAGDFARNSGSSRESVVFSLRNYLLICTPQTIVLDANVYSRDPSQGDAAKLEENFENEFSTLTLAPLDPIDPFNQPNIVDPTGPTQDCPTCADIFVNPELYSRRDLEIVQERLCLPTVDGIGGNSTKAAISIFQASENTTSEKLTIEDAKLLFSNGCRSRAGGHDRDFYKNYYEVDQYKGSPLRLRKLVGALNAVETGQPLDPSKVKDLGDDNLREKLKRIQNSNSTIPNTPFGQLTSSIRNNIFLEAKKNKGS